MISHVSVGVEDVARAVSFYDAVLAPLGYRQILFQESGAAWGTEFPTFWVASPDDGNRPNPGNGVHICFNAANKGAVDAFYASALENGGIDDGEPGLRPKYTHNYYAAFVRDPDGNKIEAVCFLRENRP